MQGNLNLGRSPFYAVSVNCLYRDSVRVRDRDMVSCRVTDRVRFRVRVRRPGSSGNLLIRRKMDYALKFMRHKENCVRTAFIFCASWPKF